MALSEAQKHLIHGLMLFGVEKDAIVGIVSAVKTPEHLDAMIEWMCENLEASVPEILRKTAELTNRPNNQ